MRIGSIVINFGLLKFNHLRENVTCKFVVTYLVNGTPVQFNVILNMVA